MLGDYGQKELGFLKKKLNEYYFSKKIKGPNQIQAREFGVGDFGKKIAFRHLSFTSNKELNDFLRQRVPAHISYSVALYKHPERQPMQKKKLFDSDLIYEFDADDIPSNCKTKHDFWVCKNCNASGKGLSDSCTECLKKTEKFQWFCEKCLNLAKKHALKLVKVLFDDFGAEKFVSTNFSGNAGYHVHVSRNCFGLLSRQARLELLDYLSLFSFDFEKNGFKIENNGSLFVPLKASGQKKRVLEKLRELLNYPLKELAFITNTKQEKLQIFRPKQKIFSYFDNGLLPALPGTKKASQKFYSLLFDRIVSELELKIDRQTSVDEKKIIRVPNTIHSGSMLPAKKIPVEKLKEFNPFSLKIYSEKEIKVFIKHSPEFYLGGQKFRECRETETSIPEYAGVFLVAKKLAVLR